MFDYGKPLRDWKRANRNASSRSGSGYPLRILATLRVLRFYPFCPVGRLHPPAVLAAAAFTPRLNAFAAKAECSVLIATQHAAIAFQPQQAEKKGHEREVLCFSARRSPGRMA